MLNASNARFVSAPVNPRKDEVNPALRLGSYFLVSLSRGNLELAYFLVEDLTPILLRLLKASIHIYGTVNNAVGRVPTSVLPNLHAATHSLRAGIHLHNRPVCPRIESKFLQ